ncbi:unnamed protein product, partial [Fusarium langsethiae]
KYAEEERARKAAVRKAYDSKPENRAKANERQKQKRREAALKRRQEKDQWQPVPEHTNPAHNDKTIAVTRKGKEIAPKPDEQLTPEEVSQGLDELFDTVFSRLPVPQADGTVKTLQQVLQGSKGPSQEIDDVPTKVTRRPNRHYGDPNYASARRLQEQQERENLAKELRQARTNNRRATKYLERAKERAETAQNDDIYILATNKEGLEDPDRGDTPDPDTLRLQKCGADVNAIDPRTVNRLQLPWRTKARPYPMRNLEGQLFDYEGGQITREIDHLKVFVGTRRQNLDLDIIPTPGHDLMLGYPWLQRYNPHIDWKNGHISNIAEISDDESNSESDDEQRSQTSTDPNGEVRREAKARPPPNGVRHKQGKGRARRVRRTIASFGNQLRRLDERLEKPKKEDRLKNVPKEYRIYDKLFQEELVTKVPQHSRWDHEICLITDDLPFQKIYNLNKMELDTLKEYLEEELRKGNIRESTSSAGFPVMFVPKKNGKLRLVVDYRRLNALTVKDRTPLPLITEL